MRWPLLALVCSIACSGAHPSSSTTTDADGDFDDIEGDPNDPLDIDPGDNTLGDGMSFLHVVCAGDSLTGSAAYRGAISGDLTAQGRSTDILDASHTGASSAIADSLAARLGTVDPDVGLIWTGLDDAIAQTDAATTLVANSAMVGHLRDSNPQIIVAITEIPDSSDATVDGGITAIDSGLPDLAASLSTDSSPVFVVADRDAFDPATDTDDGIHPNDAGAATVGHLVAVALQPHLH